MIISKTETKKLQSNTYFSSRKVTDRLIYKQYPYKKKPKGQFSSLVTHKENTNHKFSITSKEWGKVIQCYFQHLLEYLMEGYEYKLPVQMGSIKLIKIRPKKDQKYIDWKSTNEIYGEYNKTAAYKDKKRVYVKRNHWGGWQPFIKWYKGKLKYQMSWQLRLPKSLWKQMTDKYNEDPSLVYKLDEE